MYLFILLLLLIIYPFFLLLESNCNMASNIPLRLTKSLKFNLNLNPSSPPEEVSTRFSFFK